MVGITSFLSSRSRFLSVTAYAALCICVAAPLLAVCASWFIADEAGGIAYLSETGLLRRYAENSIIIALGAAGLAVCIGGGAAWTVTMLEFPGRSFFRIALVFPLAVPGYIAAMIYAYMLEGAGPVQSWIRDVSGLEHGDYPFPDIRSVPGVIAVLAFTLYPYVYLTARAAFIMQSRRMLETGHLLGYGNIRLFFSLMLPMARPALVAGAALVMMEALADYGVASLYGVPVFTTGIYRAWQGMYDPIAAARMASVLLLCVWAALALERMQRGASRYANTTGLYDTLPRYRLSFIWKAGAFILCAIPIALGFLIPLIYLIMWSLPRLDVFLKEETLDALMHSVIVGAGAAIIAGALGAAFAYRMRCCGGRVTSIMTAIAASGYAVPGATVAAGLLFVYIFLRDSGIGGGWLIGGAAGVIWACSFRFLTAAFNASETSLKQITLSTDHAAATLGEGRAGIFFRVHMPMLRAGLLSGVLIVFVDTVKELPATLLLRPFDFDTLAIRAYELAGDELLQQSGPPALLLTVIGIAPVWLISKKMERARPGGEDEV